MSTTNESLIGHIIDVRGDGLTPNLLADEQETAPKITVGDEDILVGQLGSYVSVRQGAVRILCIVTRVSEQKKLADTNTAAPDAPTLTYAQRTISLRILNHAGTRRGCCARCWRRSSAGCGVAALRWLSEADVSQLLPARATGHREVSGGGGRGF